ncbi:hypothetical protein BN1723_012507 [Verticillium longisporum]|uniref:Uncharacterized protein n=1 Tax=Verticillium longisporum TaxID=100787 RepID=A0A0G4LIX0_VERLO|nr:hypothetical protein HYQ46_003476 [Verticillium longisporum]CRK21873.1 hypothetical protein BN1723_012507 [Verticillium longisporum]CRK21982.1 hypothetical protein BN1708_013250 [Verticillium longisporum]
MIDEGDFVEVREDSLRKLVMNDFFLKLRLGHIRGFVGYDNATVIQRPPGVESSQGGFFLAFLTVFLAFLTVFLTFLTVFLTLLTLVTLFVICFTLAFHVFPNRCRQGSF